jgi:hypothetical protein
MAIIAYLHRLCVFSTLLKYNAADVEGKAFNRLDISHVY